MPYIFSYATLLKALQKNGVPVELHVYGKESMDFSRPHHLMSGSGDVFIG